MIYLYRPRRPMLHGRSLPARRPPKIVFSLCLLQRVRGAAGARAGHRLRAVPELGPDLEELPENNNNEHIRNQARAALFGLPLTTIMLRDDLAVPEPSPLPQPAAQWRTTNAWKQHDGDWYCGKHTKTRQ